MAVHLARSARTRATSLLRTIQSHPPACPCHGDPSHRHHGDHNMLRHLATPAVSSSNKDYAFEMAGSSMRFGPGATKEVGMDFANMRAKKILVVTDHNLAKLPVLPTVTDALERSGIKYDIFKDITAEPKDYGVMKAIEFGRKTNYDAYLAVGGGSVMDVAKAINLYAEYPEAELLDFVNAPLGKGKPIDKQLKPLICIPTTSGTGSECTGTSIFDLSSAKSKTGISHRNLKPTLGIVDPLNCETMPSAVRISSGLDVLCHSLESWTAVPYNERTPRPTNPLNRPAYQGANPISDIFSLKALRMTVKFLPRVAKDPEDREAQYGMSLASSLAGFGFGNAGVHLCHGLSYPISSQNPGYRHHQYETPHALIPHGVSVAITSPAVFKFTAASNPERHFAAAKIFGEDVEGKPEESAGDILGEALRKFLFELGDQPRGLKALGYSRLDIPNLVTGALPQRRVLNLAPNLSEGGSESEREELEKILEDSFEY